MPIVMSSEETRLSASTRARRSAQFSDSVLRASRQPAARSAAVRFAASPSMKRRRKASAVVSVSVLSLPSSPSISTRGSHHGLGHVSAAVLGLGRGLHLLAEVGDHLRLDGLHLAPLQLHGGGRAHGRARAHVDEVGRERDQRARGDGAPFDEDQGLAAAAQHRIADAHRGVDAPAEGADAQDHAVLGTGRLEHALEVGREAGVDFAVDHELHQLPRRGRRRARQRRGRRRPHAERQQEADAGRERTQGEAHSTSRTAYSAAMLAAYTSAPPAPPLLTDEK